MRIALLLVLFFYITISIYQISAVADALQLLLMIENTFLEGVVFIISLFLTFTPLLGPVLGIIGAVFVWKWNILFASLLFFWPYLLGLIFFFFKSKAKTESRLDSSDIEDAEILDEVSKDS